MNNNLVPSELDWVSVRSECTIYQVFKQLEAQVRADVDTRKAGLSSDSKTVISMRSGSSKMFSVMREDAVFPMPKNASVDFIYADNEIHIVDNTDLDLHVGITLNSEGRCKMKIGSIEYENWQVRRLALERLFFDPLR